MNYLICFASTDTTSTVTSFPVYNSTEFIDKKKKIEIQMILMVVTIEGLIDKKEIAIGWPKFHQLIAECFSSTQQREVCLIPLPCRTVHSHVRTNCVKLNVWRQVPPKETM